MAPEGLTEFWSEPTTMIFTTVMLAIAVRGNPVILITENGIRYGVEAPN